MCILLFGMTVQTWSGRSAWSTTSRLHSHKRWPLTDSSACSFLTCAILCVKYVCDARMKCEFCVYVLCPRSGSSLSPAGQTDVDAKPSCHSFRYSLDFPSMGHCIIINNKNFDRRTGTFSRPHGREWSSQIWNWNTHPVIFNACFTRLKLKKRGDSMNMVFSPFFLLNLF